MNENKIAVYNKVRGTVGYVIPDMNNLRREFQPGETKYVTKEELFELSQLPGGAYLLENSLMVKDQEAVKELVGEVEPEYFYTTEDIKRVMLEGSVDQFEDMLNFSPEGALETVKDLAVKLPLNDVAKRDLILKKTGFNVTNAIELSKGEEEKVTERPERKAAIPEAKTKTIVRKVVAPTVKVD